MNFFNRLKRLLFGYDFFISYARSDCSVYTGNLANKLINAGYSCYIDQWGSSPGKTLPNNLKTKLKNSSVLIVLGSDAAILSDAIHQEIELFLSTKRVIIPVNFGNIHRAEWFENIEGIALTNEPEEAIKNHAPSEALLSRAVTSFTYTKQAKRIQRSIIAALLLISVSIIGFLIISNSLKNEIEASNLQLSISQEGLKNSEDSLKESRRTLDLQKKSLANVDSLRILREYELKIATDNLVNAKTLVKKNEATAKYNASVATETKQNANEMRRFISSYILDIETKNLRFSDIKNDSIISFNDRIYFGFDKFNINNYSKLVLNHLALILKEHPKLNIRIETGMSRTWYGSTYQIDNANLETLTSAGMKLVYPDNVASILSERRAQAAKAYLISQGIEGNRIIAIGYGNYRLEEPLDAAINWRDFIGDYGKISIIQ